jgi:hypothetical protein
LLEAVSLLPILRMKLGSIYLGFLAFSRFFFKVLFESNDQSIFYAP